MSDEHKAALADGRAQGRAVRAYLEALEANKPRRGRKRTPESMRARIDTWPPQLGPSRAAMLATLRSVFSLLLSYGLLLLANGLFNPLLGVRTQIEGFATEVVGFIMAGYFLGLLIGAFMAVRVVAAVGHIRAFAAFASVMSISV